MWEHRLQYYLKPAGKCIISMVHLKEKATLNINLELRKLVSIKKFLSHNFKLFLKILSLYLTIQILKS